MRTAIIAVIVVAVLGLGAVAFRGGADQTQAHICQLTKDVVRAASPNPSETTFAACGSEEMIVLHTNTDTYDVTGIAFIADTDGDVSGHLYMVSAWRTADGWQAKLNYLAD